MSPLIEALEGKIAETKSALDAVLPESLLNVDYAKLSPSEQLNTAARQIPAFKAAIPLIARSVELHSLLTMELNNHVKEQAGRHVALNALVGLGRAAFEEKLADFDPAIRAHLEKSGLVDLLRETGDAHVKLERLQTAKNALVQNLATDS